MKAKWISTKDKVPESGTDVIGYNCDTYECEQGFRSDSDDHPQHWQDFSFNITHYIEIEEFPEEV